MIKSKKRIVITGLALVTLMTSNLAFSAQFMMCSLGSGTEFTDGLPPVKNSTVECEGDNWKTTYRIKLDKLVTDGWKIEHMNTITYGSSSVKTFFLMRKD